MGRSLSRRPLRAIQVENIGTRTWLAATITTARRPSGIRAATKKASVARPAPNREAMEASSTRPEATAAPAARVVRADWRTSRLRPLAGIVAVTVISAVISAARTGSEPASSPGYAEGHPRLRYRLPVSGSVDRFRLHA